MKILNQHHNPDTSNAIFIGRKPVGMHWGNPFSHLPNARGVIYVGTREEACDRFESWLEGTSDNEVEPKRRKWILENLDRLRGKDLVCYCAPARCHGESYVRRL